MEKKMSHARFFSLIKQIPKADKEELVWQYSNFKTTSLREFCSQNIDGYNRMIDDMQKIVDGISKSEIKRFRSAILHRLQKHGIDTTNWDHVNAFMKNKKIAGKELYKMSAEEMQVFIPKMEVILRKDRAINERIERLACLN